MGYDLLEGALATLKKAPISKTLHARFAKPELYKLVGMRKPPEYELFEEYMKEQELIVWNIHTAGKTASVGLALFVAFNGPPFVCLLLDSGKPELELSQDVVLQLLHYFFKNTDEDALFFYHGKPVPQDIHDLLVEGGFDLFEDNPTLDSDEACYVLERYTYVAYYGEGEGGGREGEFDTYAEDGEDEEAGVGEEEY